MNDSQLKVSIAVCFASQKASMSLQDFEYDCYEQYVTIGMLSTCMVLLVVCLVITWFIRSQGEITDAFIDRLLARHDERSAIVSIVTRKQRDDDM